MSNIEVQRNREVVASANVPDRSGLWKINGLEGTIRVEIPEWDTSGLPRKMTLQGESLKRRRGESKDTRTIHLTQGEGTQRISRRATLSIRPDVEGAEMAEEVIIEPDEEWLQVLWDHGWE